MSSPWIQALRSVGLIVPDLARAERFYTETWHLEVAARTGDAIYLRGTGADHHVLALHQGMGPVAQVRQVTLRARTREGLDAIAAATLATGGTVRSGIGPIHEPGGGIGITVLDPDGRVLQVVYGDDVRPQGADRSDYPIRLAHAVLNSHDVGGSQKFIEQTMGFTLVLTPV